MSGRQNSSSVMSTQKREREEDIKDTKKFLKSLVKEAVALVRSIKQELLKIQNVQANWKRGETFPYTDICLCEGSDEEEGEREGDEEQKQKQLNNKIEYLEDKLKKEQARLLSWKQELKHLQEDEEEEKKEEDDEPNAKHHKDNSFDAYVSTIGI